MYGKRFKSKQHITLLKAPAVAGQLHLELHIQP